MRRCDCGNPAQVTVIGPTRRHLCIPCYRLHAEWAGGEPHTLVAEPGAPVRWVPVGRERPSISSQPAAHHATRPAHRRGGKR